MHLVIINASPRIEEKSNTAKIIKVFLRGFTKSGNTAEVWHLSDRKQWPDAKAAYENNDNILFAIPLYVENIPGIMLEFLEDLEPKAEAGTKMSFILQGGFAEACQLRCGEAYLEKLPAYFNCEYNGTLIKGNNFAPAWLPEKAGEGMLAPYEAMGEVFADKGCFEKETATEFAKPEYMSEKEIRSFNRFGSKMQKLMFDFMAKKHGCKTPLNYKPYEE